MGASFVFTGLTVNFKFTELCYPEIYTYYQDKTLPMKFIIKFVFMAFAILATGYLLPGIDVDTVVTALIVAVVLALLNTFVKPILVALTIPIPILTLGLFLLVINALIIMAAGYFVDGFEVSNFWWALLFSIIVSLIMSIYDSATKK